MPAPRSLRTYLVGLTVGILVPPLAYNAFLVIRSAQHEQTAMTASARNRTRMAAASIDQELIALRGRLFLLAGGMSLQTSDLSEFHSRAQQAFDGMTVILSNAEGDEIVNTNTPFGQVLPRHPDQAVLGEVAETRQPLVSGLSEDPMTHRPVVMMNVPVTRDSRSVYVMSLEISSILPGILNQLDLPSGWIAAIIDRRGYIISRNRDPDRYVGQVARPAFRAFIDSADEGLVPGLSREGVPLLTAFAHTRLGQWAIIVGIPRDDLMAPVQWTIWSLVLLGAATMALAAVLAVLIGRRIARPIAGLVPVAETVGQEEPAAWQATGLAEADEVGRSLFNASKRLRDAAAQRMAAIDALRASELKYRALADDLARTGEERDALLTRMVIAQEEERKRIARDLHDSLAQYLTALRLKLDSLAQFTAAGPQARAEFDDMVGLIGELGGAVNQMAWELRPVALDSLGLRSAVENYLEEWSERARLPVDAEINLDARPLPAAAEATLFRVLQEATANVLRHAQASRVGVMLETKGDEIRMIVEDDGKGFPGGDAAQTATAGARFGLLGMRERLAQVHGGLDIESSPDSGTTLFIRIPVKREETAP